ncbi:MAG TPA: hypothetical protein VGG78_06220 [Gemmatimonadaceae bacterium]
MQHRWAAFALALGFAAIAPPLQSALGQDSAPRGRKLGTLGQNYPNPFRPETFIPFSIDDCGTPSRQRVVSLHVYNVLAQLVATPLLQGADRPVANMRLSCGDYVGYWDGTVLRTHRQAAAGVYLYELVVDGQKSSRKMFVSK